MKPLSVGIEYSTVEGEIMRAFLEVVLEFKKRVSEKFGEVKVILFGSRAKGDARENSDIDLVVILSGDVDMKAREAIYDMAYDIDLEYDVVLDVSVYSKKEWERYKNVLPFAVNVEREGVVV